MSNQYYGQEVVNKNNEHGLIKNIDEAGRITVMFYDRDAVYAKGSFQKGFLQFTDPNLQSQIEELDDAFEEESLSKRLDGPLSELNSLIGLTGVKEQINELVSLIKITNYRKKMNLKTPVISHHLAFLGNPGTGKTTVANIVAKIYKELGILSSGHLVVADRSQLVAGYVGQTAIKTKTILKKALGGVLFIDEAYALCRGKDDSFGLEAIDTITGFMEDHRDNIAIIVAGYDAPMMQLFQTNPGLISRFNTRIKFQDYNGNELYQIFCKFFDENDYILTSSAQKKAFKALNELEGCESNARDMRNIFEKTIRKQATRLYSNDAPTKKQLMEIHSCDLCIA